MTPALGLRDQIAQLFGADKRPPDVIVRLLTNQDPQGVLGLMRSKARPAITVEIPGYGHMTIWAAPTKGGASA